MYRPNLSCVLRFAASCAIIAILVSPAAAQRKWEGVWTDSKDETIPASYHVQGEYVGKTNDGDAIGCQVIALGGNDFQAVVYPGGLPGAGWDGENRSILAGKQDGKQTFLKPAEGSRNYLAGPADKFSATDKFPPKGHQSYAAHIEGEVMMLNAEGDKAFKLTKVTRQSDSMGAKPPKDAIVLFDGSNRDEWTGGRVDETTKLLNTDGADILTKRKFNNYTMHIEFMLPYRPDARGQGRGNSGFYQVDQYEVQILDSFGLEGKNNECGGVYQKADPIVNMCAPPLVWQTYDVEFTNAVVKDGEKVSNARLTVKHNGVVIHDNIEINGKTGGARNEPEGTPGPLKLQGHGNPLQYRNIWIIEN